MNSIHWRHKPKNWPLRDALLLFNVVLAGFSRGAGPVCSHVLDKGTKGVKGPILSGPLLSCPMWDREYGDRDEARVETVKDYREAFGNACMAVMPDAIYMHYIERPELYRAVAEWFLGTLN